MSISINVIISFHRLEW